MRLFRNRNGLFTFARKLNVAFMAYTFYAYLVLIDETSKISLAALEKRLLTAYKKDERVVGITHHQQQIIFYIDNYQFQIGWNETEEVSRESVELATNYLHHNWQKNKVAKCRRRLEISGDFDQNMNYLTDSIRILDEISHFRGTYIFDPQAGTFLEEL
ncbi:MAG: hypothetical protein ACPGJS_20850 [Flammeovirgaceae bacterium]